MIINREKAFCRLIAILVLAYGVSSAHAQSATSILLEESYSLTGRAKASIQPIAADHQSFNQAYRITINSTSSKIEDAGLQWLTTQPIVEGDYLWVTFWVRKIAPLDGSVIRGLVGFESAPSPQNRLLLTSFPCQSGVWTKYSFQIKAAANYPVGSMRLIFYFGFGPQTFEIGGVSALNQGPATTLSVAGAPVISTNPFQGYFGYLDQKVGGLITTAEVLGPGFSQAFQITTNGDSDFIYLSGLGWSNVSALSKGDLMLLTFSVRKLAPSDNQPIKAQVVFERRGGNFEKSLKINFPNDTTEWKQYQIPFKAGNDFAAGEANLLFQFGYGPQRFQIGGIKLVNYGRETAPDRLPASFYYSGRGEADAIWRREAEDRIERYRKGDLTVNVRDRRGNPLPGAAVYLQQVNHAFRFGSAVTAQLLAGDGATPAEREIYRSRVSSHFNTSVLENDLKWPFWEDWAGWNRKAILDALDWLSTHKISVRGHNLIWPNLDNMPANSRFLSPADLRARIDNHFAEILKPENTGGKCYQWDVLNEPYTSADVQGRIGGVGGVKPSDGLLGNAEMVRWFQNARRLDPQASLYLNDFDVIEAGGINAAHQDYFFAVGQWLLDQGAPLDGLGLQGHFDQITPPQTLQSIIDRFSALQLPMAITEFDVDLLDSQLQADYTRDVMTMIFSSPQFNDLLLWGFWEKAHWQPVAAMYRADWSSKPNALAFNDLVFREWWTDVDGLTDSAGRYSARGFKGEYNVTAIYRRTSHTARVTIDAKSELTVTLDVPATRDPIGRAGGRVIEP